MEKKTPSFTLIDGNLGAGGVVEGNTINYVAPPPPPAPEQTRSRWVWAAIIVPILEALIGLAAHLWKR